MKGVWILLCMAAAVCVGNLWGQEQLTKQDVQQIIAQAASRAAQVDQGAIIAVVDREGYVLGVWDVAGDSSPNIEFISGAIARAGTAAFLSSNQNAFTSRTAGYIIQQHFPPMVRNTPPGPLVGVGLSSFYLTQDKLVPGKPLSSGSVPFTVVRGGHSDVNFIKQIPLDRQDTFDPNTGFEMIDPFKNTHFPALPGGMSPGTFGAGIYTGTMRSFTVASGSAPGITTSQISPFGAVVSGSVHLIGAVGTSLNDSPGGVPLYKNGELVGGVGVTGDGKPNNQSTGFAIINAALPFSEVLVEPKGLSQNQKFATPGFKEGPDIDEDVALAGQKGYEPSSGILATNDFIGGIQIPYVNSTTRLGDVPPIGSIGNQVNGFPLQKSPPPFAYPAAEFGGVAGQLRFPIRGDPVTTPIGNARRLSASDVADIISRCAARSAITRAGIRLPIGTSAKVFISVVGNPGRTGRAPPILGVFRTGEATIFSWDVAVQKARTAWFFSNNHFAESSRTVGFLAQRYYPPGIDGNAPGPFFGLQEGLLITAFKAALDPAFTKGGGKANPYLPNLITIFPGGFPLYRDGVLIGAVGISGDGVDQDDIIGASGCARFQAPRSITADQFLYRGARLPYAKFPRDPSL
jgi:uncharacterized protein GlcG (DUF336 family)